MISEIRNSNTISYSKTYVNTGKTNTAAGKKSDEFSWSPEGLKKWQDEQNQLLLDPKKLQELRDQTQEMLLKQFGKGSEGESATIDPMLYNVKDDEKAAETPDYWNAENTSQRIVDFAMSFQEVSGEEFGSYLEKAREAVKKGFKEAKDMLGDLSGPSAKLFNDTYEAAMKKFDELAKNGNSANTKATAEEVPSSPSLNLVA